MAEDIIRIIEPLWTDVYSSPSQRLKSLTSQIEDSEKRSYYIPVDYENLIELFSQHTKHDVPPFNEDSFEELIKALNREESIFQYILQWVPDYWMIDGDLWIYEKKVAELKDISIRSVFSIRREGKLKSKRLKLYPELDCIKRVYIKPDDQLAYWCTDIDDPYLLYERTVNAKWVLAFEKYETLQDVYSKIQSYERVAKKTIEGTGISKDPEEKQSVSFYFNQLFGGIFLEEFKAIMNDTRFLVKLVRDCIKSLYGTVKPTEKFIRDLCTAVGITKYQYDTLDVNEGIEGDITNVKLKELARILLKLEEEKTLKETLK